MKVSRATENLQAHHVAQAVAAKQREAAYLQSIEKKKFDAKVQETRTERAKRLDLNKGRNVDIDC